MIVIVNSSIKLKNSYKIQFYKISLKIKLTSLNLIDHIVVRANRRVIKIRLHRFFKYSIILKIILQKF